MPLKKNFNLVFKKTQRRSYTYRMSKEGRTLKGVPTIKLSKYTGGNVGVRALPNAVRYEVVGQSSALWIDSSMEELRKSLLKKLKQLGNQNYFMRFRVSALEILRHHKMASKGKVDRISMGMRLAFGAPFTLAARVSPGTTTLEIWSRDLKIGAKIDVILNHVLKNHAPFTFRLVQTEKLNFVETSITEQ
jgi:ribosomal protein L16/L10AE